MQKPILSIICAIAENRAIGKNNQLLWHIKKDFDFFKKKTLGHVLLMGQKTYESIGKPLPGRKTVVITNNPEFTVEHKDVYIARSLEEGIEKSKVLESEEIFVCGGGSVYMQTIDIADKLYLTIVKGSFEADTFFPEYSQFKNIISEREDNEGEYSLKFLELEK